MRSITYVLLLAVACLLVNACRKPDFPPYSKACQLIRFESAFTATNYSRIFTYGYNNQRLMDSVTGRPSFSNTLALSFRINYNAQQMPVLIMDYLAGFYKPVYQNGRIVRIDHLENDQLYHVKYTYSYDYYGRIIRRVSEGDTLFWEYKGSSRNISKRIKTYVRTPERHLEINEYRYDNKVNPAAAWPNLTLNPFAYDLWDFSTREYEPITDNNPVYQTFAVSTNNNPPSTYMEIFFTYEYDDVYPVKAHIRQVQHNGSGPDLVTLIENTYAYDCKNNNGHF